MINRNLKPAQFWERKFGSLRMKTPIPIHSGSNKGVIWVCDCGKEKYIKVYRVVGGQKTCGECNVLPKLFWEQTKFGSLRMSEPSDYHLKSNKKIKWDCDCGDHTFANIINVTSKRQKTCGKCHVLSKDYLSSITFGRLRIENPIDIHKNSHSKVNWLCSCGGKKCITVSSVTRGDTKTCGKCYQNAWKKYEINKKLIHSLKFPIFPDDIKEFIEVLEPIKSTMRPFLAVCNACNSKYKPRWNDIRRGISITCGCSYNKISGQQQSLFNFINSFDVDPVLEYKINNFTYDIFVPVNNLLIEYNGLRWHSQTNSKKYDLAKYEMAKSSGFNYLMIFEDEWVGKHKQIKNLIIGKLHIEQLIHNYHINLISKDTANSFYKEFCYDKTNGTDVNYGIYYNNLLVMCVSFYEFDIEQNSWCLSISTNNKFEVCGGLEKILSQFVISYCPKFVYAYSDNRIDDGSIFQKLGFKFANNIEPVYWVVNGQKRLKFDEQNGRKIWDLGKKLWIYKS